MFEDLVRRSWNEQWEVVPGRSGLEIRPKSPDFHISTAPTAGSHQQQEKKMEPRLNPSLPIPVTSSTINTPASLRSECHRHGVGTSDRDQIGITDHFIGISKGELDATKTMEFNLEGITGPLRSEPSPLPKQTSMRTDALHAAKSGLHRIDLDYAHRASSC